MSGLPQFDYYTVSTVLGEGGMGIVYLATDRRSDLPVAIKLMSKRMHDQEVQFRFMRENDILSALNHRNIVRCFEITRAKDGTPCMVMEYLRGSDFRAFEGKPYPELIPLMIQTLMGMDYLRQQRIVHRDLSSNNILVILENDKRLVKILDFGIAKILHETPVDGEIATQTGQFLGKFSYASPELFFSTSVDWRTDIYSLGVVFYRLLTRQSPIRVEKSGNFYEWMMAHQRPLAIDFSVPANCPELPKPLKDVVSMMLAREASERPQSYKLIIDWLDAIQQRAFEQGLEPDPTEITDLPPPVVDRVPSRPSDAGSGGNSPRGQARYGRSPGQFVMEPAPDTAATEIQEGGEGSETAALPAARTNLDTPSPLPLPVPPAPVPPAPPRLVDEVPRRPALGGRNKWLVDPNGPPPQSSIRQDKRMSESSRASKARVALLVLCLLAVFGTLLYGAYFLLQEAAGGVGRRGRSGGASQSVPAR